MGDTKRVNVNDLPKAFKIFSILLPLLGFFLIG